MDLIVKNENLALWNGHEFRCAVGRNGFSPAEARRDGDNTTPIGRWVLREVFYRPDREKPPKTILPVRALEHDDGWCDAPEDPFYNRFVKHPYPASAEHLWRDDHLYNVFAVLKHNVDPIVPGKGSAIFLHIARTDFGPTAGCVTLAREDLLTVLREADKTSAVLVAPSP
jgi:L,D-peptidoglycan transpeptidase YkuD (ErfK/YbiS/YcfS/YnhG family)